MSRWIDFKQLRQDIDLPKLLRHYNVQVRVNGVQGQGFCPLPTHNGQRRSPSFSVNFEKKIWQCWGCKAKGNLIDLAVRMEGKSPGDTKAVREVAEMLVRDFVPAGLRKSHPQAPRQDSRGQRQAVVRNEPKGESPAASSKAVLVNPPLNFQLQNLDGAHPYLKDRNLKPATIQHFGLGYCARGMLKDRIAIPLHDAGGKLIGYAGRVVDDTLISEENPKYRFPGKRDFQGQTIEFHKSLFLYNGHRVQNAPNVLVVEGFVSTWWLTQCGYPHVVALMGSSFSDEQLDIIGTATADDGTVWIITDDDQAGNECGSDLLDFLQENRKCEWLKLSDGRQPTDYSLRELRKLIPFGAEKSGTSIKPRVAQPSSKNNVKPDGAMAASS